MTFRPAPPLPKKKSLMSKKEIEAEKRKQKEKKERALRKKQQKVQMEGYGRKLEAALKMVAAPVTSATYGKVNYVDPDELPSTQEVIKAQEGPQTDFLSCPADVVVFGGSAGGGKSFSLLMDPLRYVHHKDFGAVIFRRTYGEIKKEGALWDEATKLYLPLGASPRLSDLSFTFPSGSVISFAHLQHEKDIYSWQGSQVPYIGFDEVTHFTERQFWYLSSRQRNVAGIPNLMRCTCNPDPDSFVRDLIDWWIDAKGYAIPERSGIIRWFIRDGDNLVWAKSREALTSKYDPIEYPPKSFTFIRSTLQDNQILLKKDPSYMAALKVLPKVDKMRLLDGNWNIRPASGLYFKRTWFQVVDQQEVPPLMRICRGWDLAGTEKEEVRKDKEPAATAGVKIGRDVHGIFYVLDVRYEKVSPSRVEQLVKNCATQDGLKCMIRLPQDPGQAGKAQVAHFAKLLSGYTFKTRVMSGDKVTRAGPFSSMCEYGRVRIVRGPWNDNFLNHLEEFPPQFGTPDIVDAAVEAFHQLTTGAGNVKSVAPVSITV